MAFACFHPWVAVLDQVLGHGCEPFCVPTLVSACAGLSYDNASMCSGLGSVAGFREFL